MRRTGKGRCAAVEVMHINTAIRNLIRESKTFQIPTVMQTNRKAGMQTMDDAICACMPGGSSPANNAARHAQDIAYVTKRLTV